MHTAVATKLDTQVIDGDDQHIGLRGLYSAETHQSKKRASDYRSYAPYRLAPPLWQQHKTPEALASVAADQLFPTDQRARSDGWRSAGGIGLLDTPFLTSAPNSLDAGW